MLANPLLSLSKSQIITSVPCSAKPIARASPIPLDAPVTKAILPERSTKPPLFNLNYSVLHQLSSTYLVVQLDNPLHQELPSLR